MTASNTVRNSVAVADPSTPANVIKPNPDGSVNVDIAAAVPAQITYVDHSISSATGASQQLLAANTSRKALLVVCPIGSAAWTVDPTGGTAVANTPPAFQMNPGDSWAPVPVPLNKITAIGTATAKLVVLEG